MNRLDRNEYTANFGMGVPVDRNLHLFKAAILDRYHEYEEITFGILLADPRQSDSREYILNYLNVFNDKSGKYFDFFLPGYDNHSKGYHGDHEHKITVGQKTYYFSEEMFDTYLTELEKTFDIEYTFNPMLILMSIKPGYLNTAKYIVIELDDNEHNNCRRSGMLFSKIFRTAQSNPDLRHIQISIGVSGVAGNALSLLIKEIAPPLLADIAVKGKELKRYRVRHI